jgi:hypothetical protein
MKMLLSNIAVTNSASLHRCGKGPAGASLALAMVRFARHHLIFDQP